jgi:hypothetical protein
MLPHFKLMKRAIHCADVNAQEVRYPALPDVDRSALKHMPRQHPVDAPGRHRQPRVEQDRIGRASVFLYAAVFAFCERFVFGFCEHVIDSPYTA